MGEDGEKIGGESKGKPSAPCNNGEKIGAGVGAGIGIAVLLVAIIVNFI